MTILFQIQIQIQIIISRPIFHILIQFQLFIPYPKL